jgi:hypothetical protein
MNLNMRKKLTKYCIWSIAVYGAKTLTHWKLYQIYNEIFQAWCWRRMRKHIWIDQVKNEEVLHRFKEESNTQHTIKWSKSNWILRVLRMKCRLKWNTEGKIEGTERRGRRFKQLLDNFKEERRYWKLREEALDRTLRRTRFGRSYKPPVRQTT